MEDFIGIIVLVLIVLASASGKKKKTTEKPARQRKQAVQPNVPRFDQAFAKRQVEELKKQAERPAPGEGMREADCDKRPLHLHQVSQQQMAQAGEGEDPCHAGSHVPEELSSVYEPQPAQVDLRGQELVRGVIMSEILKRPCERMAERHNGRRASW